MTSLSEIERVVGNDEAALKTFLSAFINQTTEQLIQLDKFLKEKNLSEIKFIVHKMKSTVVYFGMNQQKKLAEEIEAGIGADFERLVQLLNKLIRECSEAILELKAILKQMG